MRRTCAIGAILGALTSACSTTGVGHGASISPPPPAAVSPSATVSPSPTGSPGPASPLTSGAASVALSGDLTTSVSLAPLAEPAVWAPPPAPMDLTWGTGAEQMRLAGTSFVSRAQTGPERTLSFTVRGSDGAVEFVSSGGECSITITPALPDNMGGLFTCTALTDAEGTVTVDARGVFSASG
jgi:hypothetical protein